MNAETTVPIKGDMIRLGQFLKVADAVDQGSDVKVLLATEAVTVNGEVEVRRGRQLHPGDVVAVGATTYLIKRRQGSTSGDAERTAPAGDEAANTDPAGDVATDTDLAGIDAADTDPAGDDAQTTDQASSQPAHDPASGRYSSGS